MLVRGEGASIVLAPQNEGASIVLAPQSVF